MSDTSCATIDAAEITPEFVRRRVPGLRMVEVRDHGELVGGFLSPEELVRYRSLISRDVEVFRAGDFPDDIVAALEDSRTNYGLGPDD